MITLQHSALTVMAHISKGGTIKTFQCEVPWVLLPDGIRAYSGPRQMSHFESLPNETDCSWMEFPNPNVLRYLTKENFADCVKTHMAEGYEKCVIGEETNIELFDKHNYGHRHYHSLRMHMIQDIILDNVLRERLITIEGRFKDQFTVRWNHEVIDGATLRKQVALFEKLGFIHLAGKVLQHTGMHLNNKWFDENVLQPLQACYPTDLAEKTFKYMVLSPEDDERITAERFELTEEDKKDFILCGDLEDVLDSMYSQAYYFTAREI